MRRSLVVVCLLVFASTRGLAAQDHHHGDMTTMPATGWQWTIDWNAFIGNNDQVRHFADANVWESQNWVMFGADRATGSHRVSLQTMLSLEPFTIHDQGSPQLFQTGESFNRMPLVHYQHPHDLLMGLGATYTVTRSRVTYTVGADLVGSPTLGPMVFMHRPSAVGNPQVPLVHHYIDATHSTPGVIRVGVGIGSFVFESSVFRGEEPDEDRLNIETPRLDSWAARVRWRRGPWEAQFSGGQLHQPEWFEPFDTTRLTASLSFNGTARGHRLATTLAWGENRQFNGFNGVVDGFLLEGNYGVTKRSTIYGRTEVAGKELFGVAPHAREFVHRHWFSDINAFTLGYLHDVATTKAGTFGVGADATAYRMPEDITSYYGGSRSFHVFLRWHRM